MHPWPIMLHHHLWMPMNFNIDSLAMGLPPFVLIVLITALVLAASSIPPRRMRRHQQRLATARPIICRSCGAEHPPFARFCSRCGQRL